MQGTICGARGAAGEGQDCQLCRSCPGPWSRAGQGRWFATPEAKEVSQTGREYDWARVGP
ncbi:hypothetical protein GCM10018987_27840 [Streptomyces cremeus]